MSAIFTQPEPKQDGIANVMLALCVHRAIDPQTMIAINTLLLCPNPKFHLTIKTGDALIDRSRGIVASQFYRNKQFDLLFFLDDDIVFDAMDVVKICRLTYSQKLDIVGGAYVKKAEKDTNFAIKCFLNLISPFGKKGIVSEVEMVSTGFMAINRHVIEKMVEENVVHLCNPEGQNFWPFFMPIEKKIDG